MPPEKAELSPSTELRRLAGTLREYRSLIGWFVLSAMLSSLALTYIYSEKYLAVKTIMFRPNQKIGSDRMEQPTALGFPVPMLPFEVIGETIEQVGTSERILRPVVSDLKLDVALPNTKTGLGWYYTEAKDRTKKFISDTWLTLKFGRVIKENPTSSAIKLLAANVRIEATRKNYTAVLSVMDKDPSRAAIICDHVADQLVSFMLDLSVQSARRNAAELAARMGEKKLQVDSVRGQIEMLKKDKNLTDLGQESAIYLTSAEQFQRQLLDCQAELSARRAELTNTTAQLEGISANLKATEMTSQDPLHDQLRGSIVEQEVELEGMLKRLPESHPDVQSLKGKLSAARKLIGDVKEIRISSFTTEPNKLHQELSGQQIKLKAQISGLESQADSLSKNVNNAKLRVPSPEVEKTYKDLSLQLEVAEADYRKLAGLVEAARAEEITAAAEVYTLHPATPQEIPIKPVKIYHVSLSVALALVLGLGLACAADYLRLAWSGSATPTGATA